MNFDIDSCATARGSVEQNKYAMTFLDSKAL
jgi:hypothetical protein